MENLLPTITVLTAEASVVLLVLLIGVMFFSIRRKRQHQAEIEALMEMANGANITLPGKARKATEAQAAPDANSKEAPAKESSPEPRAQGPASVAVETTAATPAAELPSAVAPAAAALREEKPVMAQPPITAPAAHQHEQPPKASPVSHEMYDMNDERLRQMDERLSEIRHALELMDGKISRFRQDQQKLMATLLRGVQKNSEETLAIRQEFESMPYILHEIRERMAVRPTFSEAASAETAPASSEMASTFSVEMHPADEAFILPAEPAASTFSTDAMMTALTSGVANDLTNDDDDYVLDAATLELLVGAGPKLAEYGAATHGIAVEEIDINDIEPEIVMEAVEVAGPAPIEVADQIFYQPTSTLKMKQGWYFSAAGGEAQGPFANEMTAELVMEEITGRSLRVSAGGRR
ncbi:MAG: hypothetical protein LBV36_07785 [Chromatiales bacterium]|jgi:hypothetical protein|nr:hypothetical protein [Chromatiales bacterium]